MLIVRRSTFNHIECLLSAERQATASMQKSLTAYDRDLKAANLELDQLRAALDESETRRTAAEKSRDRARADLECMQSSRDSAISASHEVVAERDRALAREREANQRAHNVATVLTDTEGKLGEVELSLDLSRSRREKIGSDLDALRSETMDLVEAASAVIRWLLAHSSGGSEADARATLLRKACEPVENLLNT